MSDLIRILVVDDSEADADLIKDQLTRDGIHARYRRGGNPEDLIRALKEQDWDI